MVKNMNILLINPPYDFKNDTVVDSLFLQPVQSMGLGYLASYMEREGHHVNVLECPPNNLRWKDINEEIMGGSYEIIGLSVYSYNYKNVSLLGNRIKKAYPRIVLVIGGFLATISVDEMFQSIPDLDYCVLGEGEETFKELADAIEKRQVIPTGINGVAYKSEGLVIINEFRKVLTDLDVLPLPKISYLSPNGMAAIISGRGCHGRCSFCSVSTYIKRLKGRYCRKRNPSNIVSEINNLVSNYNVKYISFHDDSFFTTNREWVEGFVSCMNKDCIPVEFSISARADDIINYENEIIQLADIGLKYVFVGAESFIQRQLDLYRKGTTVEENIRAINILKDNGIKCGLGIMLLDPYVCIEEVRDNLSALDIVGYARERYNDFPPVSLLYPVTCVKGSSFERLLKENGLYKPNAIGYDFIDPKVQKFYQIQRIWADKLYPLNKACSIHGKAYLREYYHIAEKLLDQKIALRELDILFCFKLCEDVMETKQLDPQEYIYSWQQKLDEINECVMHLSDSLDMILGQHAYTS